MTFRQTITPGGDKGPPAHPHDASEISGEASFITLRVNKLLAGKITGKEIIVAGGAEGILRSDGFVSGSDGWRIRGDGSAEFNDVVVRGSIINLPSGTSYPGSPSDGDLFYRTDLNKTYRYDGTSWHALDALDDAGRVGTAVIATAAIQDLAVTNAKINDLAVSKLTAGTITSEGIVITGAGGYLRSGNYSAGSAGFNIDASDGSAEFNNVTVRGAVHASSGTITGTLQIVTGSIETGGASEPRLVLEATDTGAFDRPYIDWYAELSGISVDHVVRTYASQPGVGQVYWVADLLPSTADTEYVRFRLDGSGVHVDVSSSGGTSYLRADSAVVDSVVVAVGTAAAPSISFSGDPNTGIYQSAPDRLEITTGGVRRALFGSADIVFYDPNGNIIYWYDDNDAPLGSHQWRGTDGVQILYVRKWTSADTDIDGLIGGSAFGTLLTGTASAHFTIGLTENDANDAFQIISGGGNWSTDSTWDTLVMEVKSGAGSASSLWLLDGLTDVGNHETLRLDRGTGTTTKAVGYYSSWAAGKDDILPLDTSPRFPGLTVIDQISPVDFQRKSTGQREWGFLLDDFKALSDDLRYLTTKGDQWGYSPDEAAISAVLWQGLKDARQRIAALEGAA